MLIKVFIEKREDTIIKSSSEDTMILSALNPYISDWGIVYDALEAFFKKKKEIDYNDRFNGIMFTKRGPQYLEDFTLEPDYILKATRVLKSQMIEHANIAGGIFIALTFVAETFKKISGKVFRLIVLTDRGSVKVQEDHIFFLEDLLDKVKDIPLIMDIIAIDTDDPREELTLMKLARRTGGDLYEIDTLLAEREDDVPEDDAQLTLKEKLQRRRIKLTQRFTESFSKFKKGAVVEDEICDLPTILGKLAEKKDLTHLYMNEDEKIEIEERNLLFFESLADKLIPVESKEKIQCTICFTSVKQEMLQCPFCKTYAHKICSSIWAKTSKIATNTPFLFRCHSCYNLISLDEHFINLINKVKTPVIELFEIEDLVLEEYLESLESDHRPKLVSTEDNFKSDVEEAIEFEDESTEEEEFEIVSEDSLQIIWCECGKMLTNEYLTCPQCGCGVKSEKPSYNTPEVFDDDKIEKFADFQSEINQLRMKEKSYFKSENFNEAIQIAEEILELNTKFNDKDIVQEQMEFITAARTEIDNRETTRQMKKKLIYLKAKYKTLMNSGKTEKAYQVVVDFKEDNRDFLQDFRYPKLDRFLADIKKIQDDQVNPVVAEPLDMEGPEKGGDLIIEKKKDFSGLNLQLLEEKLELEEAQDSVLKKNALIDKIEAVLDVISKLLSENAHDEAISLINSTIALIDVEDLDKYKAMLEEKKADIQEIRMERQEEEEKEADFRIKDGVKKIEKIIKFKLLAKDTVPIVREPVGDFSAFLSDDASALVEVINSLLADNREVFPGDIESHYILKCTTGEVFEKRETLTIQEIKTSMKDDSGDFEELIHYSCKTDLDISINDEIDDFILKIRIPYSLSLLSVEMGENLIETTPKKHFSESGLIFTWNFEIFPKPGPISMQIRLERRISRTMIFTHEEKIRIVNTYYDITQEGNERELLLPFTILEGISFKWTIIEDAFPLNMIPVIMEPKELIHVDTSSSSEAKLISWVYESLKAGPHLYHYKFLTNSQVKELKSVFKGLFKMGLQELEENNLIEAIKKAKEISDEFSNFLI